METFYLLNKILIIKPVLMIFQPVFVDSLKMDSSLIVLTLLDLPIR